MTTGVRWLKFNAVGAVGIAVQLGALVLLRSGLHMNYLWATALAVEAAVLHNYVWHERFTWANRERRGWRNLLRFNLATGGISILGNVGMMKLLVAMAGVNYVIANISAIAVCSTANFLVNNRCVFTPENRLQACSEIRVPETYVITRVSAPASLWQGLNVIFVMKWRFAMPPANSSRNGRSATTI